MKTILLTGASGFLADKIFDTLSSLNKYQIIMGARNTVKLSAVSKYNDIRKFDVSDVSTYETALSGVDIVVHLAAMDFSECEKNPELAHKVNVSDLEKFYNHCIDLGVKQFVYFSTIHVYGPNLSGVITEESPTNPVNVYSKTHLEAERIVLADKRIEGIVVRLSNAIGKPLFDDSGAWKLVVNDLCRQAVKNREIRLQSSGKQLRDFISASDIGNALDVILEKNVSSNVYNLGSGNCLSILDIVKIIQKSYMKIFHSIPALEVKDEAFETILRFEFSNKKISLLGFKISKDLSDEIISILDFIKLKKH